MGNHADTDIESLRAEVARLSAEVAALRETQRTSQQGSNNELANQPTSDVQSGQGDGRWTRRALIAGGLGAAAAGATGGLGASPAAAAVGGNLILGAVNNADFSPTTLSAAPLGETLHVRNTGPYGVAARFESTVRGAALSLWPGSLTSPPIDRPDRELVRGALYVINRPTMLDPNYEIWMYTGGRPPGSWVMVTSASSSGDYTSVAPFRAFDSRYQPPTGPIVTGSPRVIPIRDWYRPNSNDLIDTDVVPVGVRSITINLTITGTNSSGYATLENGRSDTPQWSSINWTGPSQTIANGLTVKLDDARRLKAFVTGRPGAQAHIIIDVTGYYRRLTRGDT